MTVSFTFPFAGDRAAAVAVGGGKHIADRKDCQDYCQQHLMWDYKGGAVHLGGYARHIINSIR